MFNDLGALGSSPDDVRKAFDDEFDLQPDGIALNLQTYYDAVTPPITERYQHWCWKKAEETKFTTHERFPPEDAIVGSQLAINNSTQTASISLTVNGEWSDSIGYTSSITTGLTFSTSVGIEGVFSAGWGFSVSVEAGESKTSSTSKSVSATVSVDVPPKSKQKVSMIATMKKATIGYETPISVSGYFGANFPDRVQGHYFWFMESSDILPTTQGLIKGEITGTRAFDVHSVIDPSTPLTPSRLALC